MTKLEFKDWMAYMEAALEDFVGSALPRKLWPRMDYSVNSLSSLEEWLLSKYPTYESTLDTSESIVLDGAARYLGETIIRTLGGAWDVKTDDPDYAYFGIPEVVRIPGLDRRICPLPLITAATDRRTGRYISQVVEWLGEDFEKARN